MAGLHPNVVIVGATGAIGSATATRLAGRGARLVLVARGSGRLAGLVERLQRDQRVSAVAADLSVMSSVRLAAKEVAGSLQRIDALVIAAAAFTPEPKRTGEGFEVMAATNHLGPFLLTNLLRDRLVGGGRVLVVAAPSTTRFKPAELLQKDESRRPGPPPNFGALRTFGATKAANLMFAFELARRAKRWDVRANAFHPGLVRSELMQGASRPVRLLARLLSREPARAGDDLAELAVSPAFDGTTGWLFKGTRGIDPPRGSLHAEAQAELWKRSAAAVGLEGGF